MKRISFLFAICAVAPLLGCEKPGENLRPDVYRAGQVNSAQNVINVDIVSVRPARVEVYAPQQRQGAQLAGGVLGAVAGGVIGSNLAGHGDKVAGTAIGMVGGGALGAAGGSLASNRTLVDGVSITYVVEGRTQSSAQVGRMCEYAPGPSTMISSNASETRIQPNASCQ